MAVDYAAKGNLNLQEAVRDLDKRLAALEAKTAGAGSASTADPNWKPTPPKKV
jgi:hypothetical protein